MQTETENPNPEEIVDEDTVDESQRDTFEEIDPSLIATIKEQQSSTALRTEKAAGPTSSTLWIKHQWSYRHRHTEGEKPNK
jgi:hypothetical protein